MKSYKDLTVWQRAYELSLLVYKVTGMFPKEETFGLTSQMRRASVSIISNIAEGNARGRKECTQFLRIAFGSASELEAQIELARGLNLLKSQEYTTITATLTEVMKMLNVMIKKLSITNP